MNTIENTNWTINEDETCLSTSLYIPWLDNHLTTWADVEYQQTTLSKKQIHAVEAFLAMAHTQKKSLSEALMHQYQSEQKQNTIQEIKFTDILTTINWSKTKVCVPKHYQSQNNYVLLLVETKWIEKQGEFPLELEVLYTNNTIELCQEMSGLWCRPEWKDYYLKRPEQVS